MQVFGSVCVHLDYNPFDLTTCQKKTRRVLPQVGALSWIELIPSRPFIIPTLEQGEMNSLCPSYNKDRRSDGNNILSTAL